MANKKTKTVKVAPAPAVNETVLPETVVHEPVVHEPVVHETVVHEPVVNETVVVAQASVKVTDKTNKKEFVRTRIVELKKDVAYKGKSIAELRSIAGEEWTIAHPEDNTVVRKYKPRKNKESESSDPVDTVKPKTKRAPSEYNIFIKNTIAELKMKEAIDTTAQDRKKPTEYMKIAAGLWANNKKVAA